MRYAMLSGVLAARAWESGRPESYDGLWKARLGGYMKSGLVNRYLYERLGQRGYEFLLSRAARHPDVRGWMHGFYGPSPWKTVLYPFVVRGLRRDVSRHGAAVPREVPESCDCTWCRCCREAAEAGT
jgi:flavin-dependent dehydrogenase